LDCEDKTLSIQKKLFGNMADGTPVNIYTLQNAAGMKAEIIPYGCRVVRLWAPDKNGNFADMIMGHDDLASYCTAGNCHGAIIGRYANRIAGAKMEINGVAYTLFANEGKNVLHGGKVGFHHKLWNVIHTTDSETPSITFQYVSKDGEEGFPGTLNAEVTYTVTADNALQIQYGAVTDKETAVNLTNHSYFNISGDQTKDVLSQALQINADYYTAADDGLIPTGELVPVTGTPFDFTTAKTIGQDIDSDDKLLQSCGGYDHNFVRRISSLII
jgi:aldose 1-epimerase